MRGLIVFLLFLACIDFGEKVTAKKPEPNSYEVHSHYVNQ